MANGNEGGRDIVAGIEQSIIGGLLLDASRYPEVAKVVAAEDFRDALYRAAFGAIGRLRKAGSAVDPLLVQEQLVRDGHDEYGDRETRMHLAELAISPGISAANVVAHAESLSKHVRKDFQSWRADQAASADGGPDRLERGGRLYDSRTGQPVVRWVEGKLPDVVDQAEAALMDDPAVGIYQRERMLVRVAKRKEPSIRNYRREAGVLGIQIVTAPYLTETFTRAAIFEKWEPRGARWKRCNAPDKVAGTYLERAGHWRLPLLWDTISSPTLRPDGSILQTPGYDEALHVFYDPCGVKFPPIPDDPSVDDARAAFKVLRDAFGSFPYESEVDRAVALSGVCTAVVRRSLPAAPLIAISSPMPNSGKTLLADGIGTVGMGSKPPVMTLASTDEEAQKTALAVLVESDPVVLIDNVSRPLEGDWLCSMLTSETYRQRVLGRTEMMTVPTRILWIATGNHIRVVGDMRTRTLLCRIDAKMENPGQRVFDQDFRRSILARRPELVTAALTLMRAFITTEQHVEDFVKPWGRFEHWSDMVRAPLVWMEADDPCHSIKTLEETDPVRGDHLRLMTAWWSCFEGDARTAREVLDFVKLNGAGEASPSALRLYEVLQEVAAGRDGTVTTRGMGRWLEARVNAPLGGMRVVRHAVRDHVAVWRVVKE